jgi:hypothetical protein
MKPRALSAVVLQFNPEAINGGFNPPCRRPVGLGGGQRPTLLTTSTCQGGELSEFRSMLWELRQP